jgi:hypothetical protein
MKATEVRRVLGQLSMGPSGVALQSTAAMCLPASPRPFRNVGIAGAWVSVWVIDAARYKGGGRRAILRKDNKQFYPSHVRTDNSVENEASLRRW